MEVVPKTHFVTKISIILAKNNNFKPKPKKKALKIYKIGGINS